MRGEARRVVAASAGLILVGAAVVSAAASAPPSPRLTLAVHGAVVHGDGTRSWGVDTAVQGQDADVFMRLRLDRAGSTSPVAVRLCPPGRAVPVDRCSVLLDRTVPADGDLELGRIATVAVGTVQRVRVDVADVDGGAPPRLVVNVTPCAPARPLDIWRRAATRPVPDGTPLAGLAACGQQQPPWRLLGGAIAATGALVPLLVRLRRRVR